LGLEVASDFDYPTTPVLVDKLSSDYLTSARVVPLQLRDDTVVIAMADPLDEFAVKAIRVATGLDVEVKVGTPSAISSASRAFSDVSSASRALNNESPMDGDALDIQQLRDLASGAPAIELVTSILTRAANSGASDVHIEPFANKLRLRLRVDGVLREIEAPELSRAPAIASRIKVLGALNIAERRLPQDGRAKVRVEGREIDLRISTMPTLYGESVVLRLLDSGGTRLDFASLGLSQETLLSVQSLVDRPNGIVLVTGPTGSGKTTTLYAALARLNSVEHKLMTVEDPVEYDMPGVNQIQVKPEIGLNFASALRSILRQDPDVIMLGEMRDLETAQIGVQAALTGHKVFSTLHTNDASASITRLVDMGLESFLLTSTLNGIIAQRLVRKLCPHCKQAVPLPLELTRSFDGYDSDDAELPDVVFKSVGCGECENIGFRGRTSVVEVLVLDDALRRAILAGADADGIREAAIKSGMLSMYRDGLTKVFSGVTSLEEVTRVTRDS